MSENKQQGASLSKALFESAKVLQEVQDGTSLTSAIQIVPIGLRPAVQSITFQALRRGYWVQEVLNQYVQKTPSGLTLYVLWAAIALVPEKDHEPMYAMHTLVNEAVNVCHLDKNLFYAKGLINAVLRRVLRNENLYQEISEDKNPSYPDWWLRKIKHAYSEQAQNIIQSSKDRPPLTLRLNQRQTAIEQQDLYLKRLDDAGLCHKKISSIAGLRLNNAIELITPVPVSQIPGFFEGACSVQDAGAQLAGTLLNLQPGTKVLDACAAPGGKTAQLLELFDIQLDALEIDPARAKRIQENLDRLKLENARVLVGDASEPESWFDGELYDAILADVPCSASGIVRRHPDITYLRQEVDIKNLQVMQRKILTALWSLLKPGGKLLYVTCSVFPEEGELQARWWLSSMPNALRLDAPGQILPSKEHDGFFYALFEKEKK
ncbi:16S rRNA (cytosine(967)-C(5))-methyltransferase RsmB [Polynucleobacter victoriensis]|uniref:16S rRNA (cytosine(967)-C(5))-methyltransferase RsmB n=1 Tax=Polynucleobacter victoriensis TaxID=2049319 RepID=UPI000B58A65F|nr:16S rRNA (cytosine(967)-C(5))-methyltransferase RsmB [Polynucleobacter victoriensis]